MVKGVNKRVIVVKSPDPRVFEEAIFIVREDYLAKGGTSPQAVMRQAQKAANDYLKSLGTGRSSRLLTKVPAPVFAAAGAAATGLAWLALRII